MWKFNDFSITQILREINFRESSGCNTNVFPILEALHFVNVVLFFVCKASECAKMADFETLDSPTLISRKI